MEVSSVNAGNNAYTLAKLQTNESLQPVDEQKAQPAERQEPRAEERVERTEEAPKATVNAQGQVTGTLVNVMA